VSKTYSERASEARDRYITEQGARLVYKLYISLLRVRVHMGAKIKLQPYDELTYTQQRHFKRAATDARAVEAEPRLYVAAQFAAFDKFGGGRKRLLPQPSQMFGIAAQTRYLETISTKEAAHERLKASRKSQHRAFFREERKLKAWCKSKNMTQQEVLLTCSEEFTPEFLEHKGVSECL